jgi:arsenate reductase
MSTINKVTIYHNPRCSKSRQTLQLLEDNGVSPEVVLYLETPPDTATLRSLLKKLAISPRELLRKSEDAYKENKLSDESLTDEQLLAAMVAHPKLIERPIVVKGNKAILGRPPENVLSLV